MKTTPEWMSDSLCKNLAGDIWFPPFEATNPEQYYAIAKTICNVCPVWKECLDIGIKETYGVWGGLSPQDRTPLQKSARVSNLALHGTVVRYRQGCKCTLCEDAHANRNKYININVIPNNSNDLGDLKIMVQKLLGD